MKHGRIFWGTFFIVLGILGLLSRIGIYLNIDFDSDWVIPLLLVLLGFTFILKNNSFKLVIVVIAGFISAFAVSSTFIDNDADGGSLFKARIEVTDDDEEEDFVDSSYDQTSEIPYYSLNTMKVKFLCAASDMNVSGKNTTDFTAKISGKKYDMDFHEENGNGVLKIIHQKNEKSGLSLKKINVRLNDEPEYNIVIKSGASDLNFDLSDLNISNFKADLAATDAEIKFGDKSNELNAKISFAASELTIYVPENVGCKIVGDYAIVSKSLRGFVNEDDNTVITPNYSDAENKINIELKGALADFEIKFY